MRLFLLIVGLLHQSQAAPVRTFVLIVLSVLMSLIGPLIPRCVFCPCVCVQRPGEPDVDVHMFFQEQMEAVTVRHKPSRLLENTVSAPRDSCLIDLVDTSCPQVAAMGQQLL